MVALKELSALDSEDPAYARRFLQESRLAGSLSHPAIVHVYDYFEYDGTPFIAMEYVAGGSLRPHVGHVTFAQIIGVLDAMLAALTRAEREGIVHRDVKPENVLVSTDGHVKIADFGIAKAINRVNPSGFLTATGMAIGTPAYMAPEQAMAGAIGPWTDLYAVGCIAYELFTSTIPFAAPENQMAMLVRRINEPIPPPDTVNPALPAQLSAWIAGLLARDPGARTRSAETAANELEDIVIGIAGPRWRRTSRLPATAVEAEVDPLTTTGAPRPPATRRPIEGRFGEAGSAAGTEPRRRSSRRPTSRRRRRTMRFRGRTRRRPTTRFRARTRRRPTTRFRARTRRRPTTRFRARTRRRPTTRSSHSGRPPRLAPSVKTSRLRRPTASRPSRRANRSPRRPTKPPASARTKRPRPSTKTRNPPRTRHIASLPCRGRRPAPSRSTTRNLSPNPNWSRHWNSRGNRTHRRRSPRGARRRISVPGS